MVISLNLSHYIEYVCPKRFSFPSVSLENVALLNSYMKDCKVRFIDLSLTALSQSDSL